MVVALFAGLFPGLFAMSPSVMFSISVVVNTFLSGNGSAKLHYLFCLNV